jgi:PAS domain S-box-containing protein
MLSPDTPIRRRITVTLLMTTGLALLLSCLSFISYEFMTSRRDMQRGVGVLSQLFAQHSANALANNNMTAAAEIINELEVDRSVTAAAMYDRRGRLLLRYPKGLDASAVPTTPGDDGERFESAALAIFRPVIRDGERVGTVYLKAELYSLYGRISSYSLLAATITALCFLVAYLLSRGLQRQISDPVLELAATARAVSERHDYSVRSPRRSSDEFGLLTDAFNHMLSQIQGQDRQVRESEARVRAVLDSALSAVVVTDAENRIVDWNSQAQRLFGWTRAEALGQDMLSLIIVESSHERHRDDLHRLIGGETAIFGPTTQLTARRQNREEFLIEASTSAVRSGSSLTFCTFITDVTERQQADEWLRSSQRLLQSIIDNATAIIYVKDLAGRYILVNRRYEDLFHLTRAWVTGKTDYELFPQQMAEIFRNSDNQVITSGVPVQAEEAVPVEGGTRTYLSNKCPLYDTDGKPYAVCGISADITDRKQSERRQRQQLDQLGLLNRITGAISERQDLASIFRVLVNSLEENLPVDFACLCSYSPEDRILTVSSVGRRSAKLAAAVAMTDREPVTIDDVLRRCTEGRLAYEPDTSAVQDAFARRLATAGLHSVVAAPLMAEGKVSGVLIVARQRSLGFNSSECDFLRQLSEHAGLAAHQARLYAALQQAYEDLRQSQHSAMQQDRLRAMGQMATGVAHDINNALSPAVLQAQSLLESEVQLSARARHALVTIQQALYDVGETVSRVREFSRPQPLQPTLGRVDLNDVIRDVVELTRARWETQPLRHGVVVDVRTDLHPELPPITVPEAEIRDALVSLLFNAVEAMPDGGVLTLRTALRSGRDGEQVSVEVQDTGSGMDEETQRRCLEPYFTTKGELSNGLGLGTVYGVTQRHGADLKFDSAPGQGTTVRLVFAVAPGNLAANAESGRPSRPLHILIVDDDPLVIDALQDVLRSDGHAVAAAGNGQAGIDCFMTAMSGKAFDVVITDLGMPYVDGGRVAAAVKGIAPMTPVILLTGWGHRILDSGDLPPHVDRVLAKPARLRELRRALKECCDMPAGRTPAANTDSEGDGIVAAGARR